MCENQGECVRVGSPVTYELVIILYLKEIIFGKSTLTNIAASFVAVSRWRQSEKKYIYIYSGNRYTQSNK